MSVTRRWAVYVMDSLNAIYGYTWVSHSERTIRRSGLIFMRGWQCQWANPHHLRWSQNPKVPHYTYRYSPFPILLCQTRIGILSHRLAEALRRGQSSYQALYIIERRTSKLSSMIAGWSSYKGQGTPLPLDSVWTATPILPWYKWNLLKASLSHPSAPPYH